MEPEQNMAGCFRDAGDRAGADFRTAVLPLYPCIERLINNIGWQYGCLRHAVKAGLQNYMVVWVYSASLINVQGLGRADAEIIRV